MIALLVPILLIESITSSGILLSKNRYTNSSIPYNFRGTIWDSSRAVDGNTNGTIYHGFCFSSNQKNYDKWFLLALDELSIIEHIEIHTRTDCCKERSSSITLYASFDNITEFSNTSSHFYKVSYYQGPPPGSADQFTIKLQRLVARNIVLYKKYADTSLEVCEIEVYGHRFVKPNPGIYQIYQPIAGYENVKPVNNFTVTTNVQCTKTCFQTLNCVSYTIDATSRCLLYNHAGGTFALEGL